MVRQIFGGIHVVLAGDFGAKRSHADIKRWIEAHGGTTKQTVDSSITHLVATKNCWVGKAVPVVQACKYPSIKIVSVDWLEDSMRTRRCRNDRVYLWSNLDKKDKTTRNDVELEKRIELRKKVREFLAEQEKLTSVPKLDGFQIYKDTTGFAHNITLVRPNMLPDSIETIQLQLLQSRNGPPHTYATMAIYTKPEYLHVMTRLTPMACQFQEAFVQWRKLFKSRTGVSWKHRLWGAQHTQLPVDERLEETFNDVLDGYVGMIKERPSEEEDTGGGLGVGDGSEAEFEFFAYFLPQGYSPLGLSENSEELIRCWGCPPKLEVIGGSRKQFRFGDVRFI